MDEYGAVSLAPILLQWVPMGILLWFTWYTRKASAKAAEVDLLKNEITTLKEQIKHFPSAQQFAALQADIKGLSATVTEMNGTLKLVNSFLLKHNKG